MLRSGYELRGSIKVRVSVRFMINYQIRDRVIATLATSATRDE